MEHYSIIEFLESKNTHPSVIAIIIDEKLLIYKLLLSHELSLVSSLISIYPINPNITFSVNGNLDTLLHHSIINNLCDIAKQIINLPNFDHTIRYRGFSMYYVACEYRMIEIAEIYLDRGWAVIDEVNDNCTTLYYAVGKSNIDMVLWLLMKGASLMFMKNGCTVIEKLVSQDNWEEIYYRIEEYVEKQVDPHELLWYAVKHERIKLVSELLDRDAEKGLDINRKSYLTPKLSYEMTKLLLDRGAIRYKNTIITETRAFPPRTLTLYNTYYENISIKSMTLQQRCWLVIISSKELAEYEFIKGFNVEWLGCKGAISTEKIRIARRIYEAYCGYLELLI